MQHFIVAAWMVFMIALISSGSNTPVKPAWDPIAHPGLIVKHSPDKGPALDPHTLFCIEDKRRLLI